jgi:hypothetical protein
MSGKMTIAKSTTAQRNAVRPYCKDLRPAKSEADWAKGMAQMSATEKGKLETKIRKFECQLLAYKNALKAHGEEAYDAAREDAKARMKEVKELKLDYSSDEGELSDYGGDDDDETSAPAAGSAGSAGSPAAKGKPAKEKQAGGRKKGFASRSAFTFFCEYFQKQVREKQDFREAMMAAHNWDGTSWSRGGAKDNAKITIMQIQGKEWHSFQELCKEDKLTQQADASFKSSNLKLMAKFESRAAESKAEVTEAVAKWKELLKTDPEAAKAFQDSRIKKKDAEDAVAQ